MRASNIIVAALVALAVPGAAYAAPTAVAPTAEQQAMVARMDALLNSLHPVYGKIEVPSARAVLDLGNDYYFLPAVEAKRVLTEGWGNPPDAVTDVLGIVFPKGKTFVDDTWGAVVTFKDLGYVDDDAESTDYDQILADSRSGEEELNESRKAAGFAAQHLVGWAQPPSYDKPSHSLIWARQIHFGDQPVDVLNYDVRLLGRSGVLSLNMIASMPQLAEIREAARQLAAKAAFDPGARYADFNPSTDKSADYGIAGLVAAGVGVAAAKKLGMLGLILAFGKKFIVLVLALGAGVAGWIRKRFSRAREEI